jgi:transcriptional regulator with XRE-family HTH domain
MDDNEMVVWLNEQLNERGWSMRELARRSGLSHAVISLVLSKHNAPGLDFCVGVARALDVPPENVLRMAGLIPKRTTRQEMVDEILYHFEGLNEDDQLRVITMTWALSRRGRAGAGSPSAA